MCLFKEAELYWVNTNMRPIPACRQLEMGISTNLYLPAMGTQVLTCWLLRDVNVFLLLLLRLLIKFHLTYGYGFTSFFGFMKLNSLHRYLQKTDKKSKVQRTGQYIVLLLNPMNDRYSS